MDLFDRKADVAHTAVTIDNAQIAANDYNLSVSAYVTPKDTRERVDIAALNAEIAQTVAKINALRTGIDSIIKEIEA